MKNVPEMSESVDSSSSLICISFHWDPSPSHPCIILALSWDWECGRDDGERKFLSLSKACNVRMV
jgi:hypothetical protein